MSSSIVRILCWSKGTVQSHYDIPCDETCLHASGVVSLVVNTGTILAIWTQSVYQNTACCRAVSFLVVGNPRFSPKDPLWFYPWWVGNKGIVVQSASGWLSPTKLRLSWALRRPTKVCSQPKAVPYKMTRVYGPCPTWWAQPQFLQRGDFPTMFLVYDPSFSTIFMPFWGL